MRFFAATLSMGTIAIGFFMAQARAVEPTADEIARSRRWVNENFPPAGEVAQGSQASLPPFSFVYGGRPSGKLLGAWKHNETTSPLGPTRTRRVRTCHDPDTGLMVRCVIVEYRDFPAVEWTLHFRNEGKADTPILEDIRSLDVWFHRRGSGEFLLHHNVGSLCAARDYAPLETRLGPGSSKRISAAGGRPTSSDMSYFNLECGGGGVVVAVGWPGQWAADFVRDSGDAIRVRAGQELTHFKLHPGEEVRTPLSVLLFWQGGDWIRAQNVWRRWFIAHNIRRPGAKLPPIQWCGASETGTELMTGATEENQKRFVDAYLERGLKPDFWWMDAGWYPCRGQWWNTGTWEPDKNRFPRGLRPVTDYLHAKGIRAILWFEPERVTAGSWLANTHPEWIHGGKGGGLLDLGNADAWNWLVNHVDGLLTREGIDIYRQDFNMEPLAFWRGNDRPDRQGITEIRHVTGLLAYWDELLHRHPNMLYDNCASGGRRNDLESMRRGVPYTKSDYADDPVGVQGQTYGISCWLPYFAATWGSSDDPYLCRSRIAPVVGACLDLRIKDQFKQLPRRLEEWRKVVPHYWGDFWPLTQYSLDNKLWIAWQFDLPEAGHGVVQAFRRSGSPCEESRYKLRGLVPGSRYRLTNLDLSASTETSGRKLMEAGLPIAIPAKPGAAIVLYERIR